MVKIAARAALPALTALLTLPACGDDAGGGPAIPAECNPLGGERCILPFPSSVYLVDDPGSPTGVRVDIPPGALPSNQDGAAIDPALYSGRDGFSPAAPILVNIPGGIDPSNLPSWTDYAASLSPDSPTVLIDMETGERVAHFAELDARAPAPEEQALYIRPAALLAGGRRYAVAIRTSLRAPDGGALPVPAGFRALLDGETTDHERLERIRPRHAEVMAALSQHGIEPDDVVVAWDFVTASRASMRADLIAARDAALSLIEAEGDALGFEVTRDDPPGDERFAREVHGTLDAPLFLADGGDFSTEATLLRGPDGLPVADGTYRIPFTAIVPACALEAEAPVPLMVYGHGLLGSADQVASGGTRTAAAGLCVVAIGTDLRGMSTDDLPNVVFALADLNRGPLVFEVLIQGVVNHISLVQMARGRMATELFGDGEGGSLIDPDRVFYYGISQGGIFGATIAAYDPVIERAVLQVGAMNYSMMLERSLDWPTYRTVLSGSYRNALDLAILLHLMQWQWDATDPVSVADAMLTGEIPGVPAKQVLLQMAVADDEVSNLATEYQARSMAIPVLAPTVSTPWGVEAEAGPLSSALVIFDFGLGATIPVSNEPPPDNDVHGRVRKMEATIEMMRAFYERGEIVQTCGEDGCTCHQGGCGAELP
ncbi:MAG TPA: hypothetical protein VKZ63_22050 [Kofleriaceae bacterium]|nr:hypothetical protein [Kofleriaceae bacterium]